MFACEHTHVGRFARLKHHAFDQSVISDLLLTDAFAALNIMKCVQRHYFILPAKVSQLLGVITDYYKMDGQLHCLHCYGHASVRLYSAYAFAGKSIMKTVQRRKLSAIAVFANPQCGFFPNFLIFVGYVHGL